MNRKYALALTWASGFCLGAILTSVWAASVIA